MSDGAQPPDPTVIVLVCGNLDRCDDGAALRASSTLLPTLNDPGAGGVEVHRCGQLDVQDLLDAPAGVPLIIVDTAAGIEPGRIVTLTFDELLSHPRGPVPHSSHALPIDQVIGISRELAAGDVNGLFVGIGGTDFGFGRSLSAPVHKALPDFAAAIEMAINAPIGA